MDSPKITQEDGPGTHRIAVPGMKRKDGTYIPAVVPPEWETFDPLLQELT
jgi:hypothetical protein